MPPKSRRLIIVIALGIVAAWVILQQDWLDIFGLYKFDPAVWKATSQEQRYDMAGYLVKKKLLLGKTRSEVIDMLGVPDGTEFMLLYNLGQERGSFFAIDDDWLDIRLRRSPGDPIVESARIRSD